MLEQLEPELLQRDHWYAKVIGVAPDHVPSSTASVEPRAAGPETVGGAVFVGGRTAPGIVAVCAELAFEEPEELDAATVTRSVDPTSAPVGTYVFPVAPEIVAQPGEQRSQAYATTGPVPDQPPAVALNEPPCTAVPVTVGTTVFAGATTVPMNRMRLFCSSATRTSPEGVTPTALGTAS
jgi:hypothetical protein